MPLSLARFGAGEENGVQSAPVSVVSPMSELGQLGNGEPFIKSPLCPA